MSKTHPTVALVIASNREDRFREWAAAWWGPPGGGGFPWDTTLLVQDGSGPRFAADGAPWERIVHATWDTITPGDTFPGWLSRCDSGIKAWGFLRAVTEHRADVVITLDDDCLPCAYAADARALRRNPPCSYATLLERARHLFVDTHLAALTGTERWATTVPGFRPRGLPYGTPDPLSPASSLGRLPVALNMGVWDITPDRDSVHELTNRDPEGHYRPWYPPRGTYRQTRVMSPQQYWPLCGMNLAFRREITPLLYFPRMGVGVPFRRFDDIWCGVIAQKCLRHLGLAAAVGRPMVQHVRASDPMTNLVNESPGIRANEEFWQVIDRLSLNGCNTPDACMVQLGEQLRDFEPKVEDPNLKTYLPQLGRWMIEWVLEFHKAGWDEGTSE